MDKELMDKNTPLASIILVSYNVKDLLLENLKNLTALPYEIVVVDNASKDGTPDAVRKAFPSVKLIKGENIGYGRANNVGVEHSTGEYIILLNTDAFIEPEAIPEAIKLLMKKPNIGLIGAKLVGLDGAIQPSARQYPTFFNRIFQLFGLSSKYSKSPIFGRVDFTWANPDVPQSVDWVPTAFAALPRQVYNEVGGFDPRFFLFYEDVDICRRIKKAGYEIIYWPLIKVVHIGGQSSEALESEKMLSYRIESAFQYHKLHEGALGVMGYVIAEGGWHLLRLLKHSLPGGNPIKRESSLNYLKMLYNLSFNR